MRMIVTPVSAWPWRIVSSMGAAPLRSGRSDAWMLIVPRGGRSMIACGRMCPYATTTETSGARSRSCATKSSPRGARVGARGPPSAAATRFTGGGSRIERDRPMARSGCVTTPTTSNPSPRARAAAARSQGCPKAPRTHSSLVGCSWFREGSLSSFLMNRILLLFLRPFRHRRAPLQDAQIVDEQLRAGGRSRATGGARGNSPASTSNVWPSSPIARSFTRAGRLTSLYTSGIRGSPPRLHVLGIAL